MSLQTLYVLLCFTCCFGVPAFAQRDTVEVARLDKPDVVIYSIPGSKYLLVWKNGAKTKSKIIFTEEAFCAVQVSIETQQLDGKGNEELLIRRSYVCMHSYGADNGGWSAEKEATVIFNLDTWVKMFEAVSYLANASEEVTLTNDSVTGRESTSCFYRYKLETDAAGIVRISELKRENRSEKNGVANNDAASCTEPDHQPGIYYIKNGVYVRKEI